MPRSSAVSPLIGDLVGSKRHLARGELQTGLMAVLARINDELQPRQPLEPTLGDEFQGVFATIADAAFASLLIRLELLVRGSDSRYGIGWGAITVFDAERAPTSQDGPGWWSARAAIDRSKALASRPRTTFVRTCFEAWNENGQSSLFEPSSVDAFLFCRDASVNEMNDRECRLLMGVLRGRRQEDLAADEGITQGAISQTLRRSGALVIDAAHRRLSEGTT